MTTTTILAWVRTPGEPRDCAGTVIRVQVPRRPRAATLAAADDEWLNEPGPAATRLRAAITAAASAIGCRYDRGHGLHVEGRR